MQGTGPGAPTLVPLVLCTGCFTHSTPCTEEQETMFVYHVARPDLHDKLAALIRAGETIVTVNSNDLNCVITTRVDGAETPVEFRFLAGEGGA